MAISLTKVRDISPLGKCAKLLRSGPQTGFTSDLPAKVLKPEPADHWQRAVKAIDDAIIEARHDLKTARSLFASASYGQRDSASLEQLRAIFAKEGIPTEFLSHYEPDEPFACLKRNDGSSDKLRRLELSDSHCHIIERIRGG